MEESIDSSADLERDDKVLEDLVRYIRENVERTWNELKTSIGNGLRETGAIVTLDRLARNAAKHPYLALGFCLGCIAFALPFLILLCFALTTVIITFTGFIFLEGTLITFASILLFGCLGAVVITLLFFGGITLTGYFGFMHIYDLYSGLHNKTALTNFLNNEKTKTT